MSLFSQTSSKAESFVHRLRSSWVMLRLHRVAVGLSWTRARVSNPRFGQGWTYPSRPSGSDGLGFLSGRVTRARTFVRRIGSDRHSCPSDAQSEFRPIQKARVGRPTLGLVIKFCPTGWTGQAILSEPEPWASSGVLTLGLGFGFCPSGWVGLKKSVRTQPDGHTKIAKLILFPASECRHIVIWFFDEYSQCIAEINVRRENRIIIDFNELNVVKRYEKNCDINVNST